MKTNILTLVVTLTIGIILTGSLLMPVLSDASKTDETFTNSGLYDMEEIEVGDVWQRNSSTGAWTLNDDSVTTQSGGYFVFVTNNTMVRDNGQVRGTTATGNPQDTKITVQESTISLNGTGLNGTAPTYSSGYGVANEGAYTLTNYLANRATTTVYVEADTPIYATDTALVNNVVVMVHAEGSIKDGITITAAPAYNSAISDITVSDITVVTSEISGYKDLYSFKEITYTVTGTVSDTSVSATGSLSSVVVSKEIKAELSDHLDTAEIAILAAIPVMIIIALILTAVKAYTKD